MLSGKVAVSNMWTVAFKLLVARADSVKAVKNGITISMFVEHINLCGVRSVRLTNIRVPACFESRVADTHPMHRSMFIS